MGGSGWAEPGQVGVSWLILIAVGSLDPLFVCTS
jgi:hypothetical protein